MKDKDCMKCFHLNSCKLWIDRLAHSCIGTNCKIIPCQNFIEKNKVKILHGIPGETIVYAFYDCSSYKPARIQKTRKRNALLLNIENNPRHSYGSCGKVTEIVIKPITYRESHEGSFGKTIFSTFEDAYDALETWKIKNIKGE